MPGFDPGPGSVEIMVQKLALGQVFLTILRVSLVIIMPTML